MAEDTTPTWTDPTGQEWTIAGFNTKGFADAALAIIKAGLEACQPIKPRIIEAKICSNASPAGGTRMVTFQLSELAKRSFMFQRGTPVGNLVVAAQAPDSTIFSIQKPDAPPEAQPIIIRFPGTLHATDTTNPNAALVTQLRDGFARHFG